jgi:hypothetical protein
LPPLLYVLTIRGLETFIENRYTRQLENTFLGDTAELMSGSVSLRETVAANIDRFLRGKPLTRYGLILQVTVTTEQGTIIYPAVFRQEDETPLVADPQRTAAENFRLMNEGLVLTLNAELEPLTLLPTLILAVYILAAVGVLFIHYRRASGRLQREEQTRMQEMETLRRQERDNAARLADLDANRQALGSELSQLKNTLQDEKQRASRNEDELIEEIEVLEKKLEENLLLQEQQKEDIAALSHKIDEYEKALKKDEKQKTRAAQAVGKRFNAIYKNLSISDRALSGFVDLNEDLKIKAEEIIHKLNEQPDQVTIKRKVFIGKRDKKSIMEVIFGYKGRLYFWKGTNGTVEVLAIGTKNTQNRELEYLNNL